MKSLIYSLFFTIALYGCGGDDEDVTAGLGTCTISSNYSNEVKETFTDVTLDWCRDYTFGINSYWAQFSWSKN